MKTITITPQHVRNKHRRHANAAVPRIYLTYAAYKRVSDRGNVVTWQTA